MRTDCGTENVLFAGVQSFLRAECNDDLAGEKVHRYGPSTDNALHEDFVVGFDNQSVV